MSKTDEQSGSTILDTIKTLLVAGIIAISFDQLLQNRLIYRPVP